MDFAYKFLIFSIALSIIVFVHEYGHFWVARKNGIRVDVFSIGFGPEFFGWTDKLNTRWKFCIIPLGGYVKMYGDADASSKSDTSGICESEKHLTMEGKTPLQRIAVAGAGPVANFIFTIVVFIGLFIFKGLPEVLPIIESVKEDTPAFIAGLKPEDKILTINEKPIKEFFDVRTLLRQHAGELITLKIERNGKQQDISVDLNKTKGDSKKPTFVLGVIPKTEYKSISVFESVHQAFTKTGSMIVSSFGFLFSLLTFQEKSAEIGGIITIGDQVTQAADKGISVLIEFMALLSLQLGVINLLPVPVLDGGHILMNTIELLLRRPITQKTQDFLYKIGFVFVLGLMGYGIFSDITRYAVVEKFLALIGFK